MDLLKEYTHLMINEKIPNEVRRWQVQNYGILEWKEVFNPRQLLFSLIFCEEINNLYTKIKKTVDNEELTKAIKDLKITKLETYEEIIWRLIKKFKEI